MAREKGTGSLQQEKSGRWTVRVGINGKRLSRSARTKDRNKAEAFLNRMLAPLGLGAQRLPLAEAWHHYEMAPNKHDLSKSTLRSKRAMWMVFSRWIEHNHPEITDLAQVTSTAVAEYLAEFRCHHSASTYNGHVCALREIFRVLAKKAGVVSDPWEDVYLRADDSISRRELTMDELVRLHEAAKKSVPEWHLLVMVGTYTGLRLGDSCLLKWEDVNLERGVIQVIPEKTKKHAHGRPVTIPIHPSLLAELQGMRDEERGMRGESSPSPIPPPPSPSSPSPIPHTSSPTGFVNPVIAEMYIKSNWRIDEGLRKLFKAANIEMSYRMDGRSRKVVSASFHSLRHTFVSFSANAGVPLAVVQSIVGHTSTAMTRHYYHENEAVLRSAVEAIPAIGTASRDEGWGTREERDRGKREEGRGKSGDGGWEMRDEKERNGERREGRASARPLSVASRLKRLEKLASQGLITQEEFNQQRTRILSEL